MATWITHLMIADGVLRRLPGLHRRGFCVGNIAPDCNVENEDWTAFTPSREVTHWMQGERKKAADCEAFCQEYILRRNKTAANPEEYAFLLGYYAHLLTDAAFQAMIREESRVKAAWRRIREDPRLEVTGIPETWDGVKRVIPKGARMAEIHTLEGAYLAAHPDSGYLTEILPLKEFPDYIDYLPPGAIVRKIGVMGYLPDPEQAADRFVSVSREEYAAFVEDTVQLVLDQLTTKKLVQGENRMDQEALCKLSPAQLVDLGICPTCFNREHGGVLYGDNADKLLYQDEEIECFFVGNPRADGHMCISTVAHYHDMSEAPDRINEKIIRFTKQFMRILCAVYGCERVYLCTMCDGPNNHYHIQLIPRYADEKRGSKNFVKPRKTYVPDPEKLESVRRQIAAYAQKSG